MNKPMKQISLGETTFISPKEMTPGQEITGTYQGGSKSGDYDTLTHYFADADGNRIGVNGTGKLNALLARVPQGTLVTVRYLGKATIASGKWAGKAAHDFAVFAAVSPSEQVDEDLI